MTHSWEELTGWVDDLASTDPVVRDETALTGLTDAILGDDPVDDDTASALLDHALRPDGPLSGLGEPEGGDGIFGRSFTLEVLAVVSSRENASPFLDPGRRVQIRRAWLEVVERERDFRARVEGQGWAHVVAHAADLADEIAAWPADSGAANDPAAEVLEGLALLVGRSPRVYDEDEEDRIAHALASAVRRRPGFLDDIVAVVRRDTHELDQDVVRRNWKAIVRSLHFRLGADDDRPERLRDLEAELTGL
mgnify:CR=1 FL=1